MRGAAMSHAEYRVDARKESNGKVTMVTRLGTLRRGHSAPVLSCRAGDGKGDAAAVRRIGVQDGKEQGHYSTCRALLVSEGVTTARCAVSFTEITDQRSAVTSNV
jgi:hypothetical protein